MDTQIVNLAARHLSYSAEIANVLTERSEMARAARAFYDIAKSELIRAAMWPMFKRTIAMALISSDTASEWLYTYRIPVDCELIRGLVLPNYFEESIATPSGYMVPYEEGADADGRYIKTNLINAKLSYSTNDVPELRWPSDLKLIFSYLLAFYMAPSVTGGDPFKLGAQAFALYERKLSKAQAIAYNEEYSEQSAASSEMESSRL